MINSTNVDLFNPEGRPIRKTTRALRKQFSFAYLYGSRIGKSTLAAYAAADVQVANRMADMYAWETGLHDWRSWG